MFQDFTLAGLTIDALTEQVIGALGTPIVAAAILAMLALVLAPRITHLLFWIVGMGGNGNLEPGEGLDFAKERRRSSQYRAAYREAGQRADELHDSYVRGRVV
jgi:hypothetical protein